MKGLLGVVVREGKRDLIKSGYLWVFKEDILNTKSLKDPGLFEVFDEKGRFLGIGFYNPRSNISLRLFTLEREALDRKFFRERFRKALSCRLSVYPGASAFRVVFSESDYVPGLVVDLYGKVAVAQILTLGVHKMWDTIESALKEVLAPSCIVKREDAPVRELEGLPVYPCKGTMEVVIEEFGIKYLVDVKKGHKTGFYFDQKDNRVLIRNVADGKRILDVFSYTGGWTMNALKGGATEVISVDTSSKALSMLLESARLNSFDVSRITTIKGDAFKVLKDMYKSGERFDVIVSDPPAFAKKRADVKNALRGYKYINLYSLKLLKKGGFLFTFSCSQHISFGMLLSALRSASKDSGVGFKIVKRLSQSMDHPINPAMPETEYLKGIMAVVL